MRLCPNLDADHMDVDGFAEMVDSMAEKTDSDDLPKTICMMHGVDDEDGDDVKTIGVLSFAHWKNQGFGQRQDALLYTPKRRTRR